MLAPKDPAPITLRPMVRQDLPMLGEWLTTARIRDWFTEPDYLTTLAAQMDDDRITQWIVEADGQPVAYLQDYRIHGWEDHPLKALPERARGLDTFIGDERWMGRGLGPRYLAQHCRTLFAAGAPALGIDPDPANAAAIRAYEKAGFVAQGETRTKWGNALVMTLWPTPSPSA